MYLTYVHVRNQLNAREVLSVCLLFDVNIIVVSRGIQNARPSATDIEDKEKKNYGRNNRARPTI